MFNLALSLNKLSVVWVIYRQRSHCFEHKMGETNINFKTS